MHSSSSNVEFQYSSVNSNNFTDFLIQSKYCHTSPKYSTSSNFLHISTSILISLIVNLSSPSELSLEDLNVWVKQIFMRLVWMFCIQTKRFPPGTTWQLVMENFPGVWKCWPVGCVCTPVWSGSRLGRCGTLHIVTKIRGHWCHRDPANQSFSTNPNPGIFPKLRLTVDRGCPLLPRLRDTN